MAPFIIVAGHKPRAPDQVVVTRGLLRRAHATIGDRTPISVRDHIVNATIVGSVKLRGAQLQRQSAVFFADATATNLWGRPGRVDAIGVTVNDGATPDGVARVIRDRLGPDATVLTGLARGRGEFLASANAQSTLVALSAVFGVMTLFVAIFVVAAMFALVLQQRQRELALLRAVAATPRQLRRMIRLELLALSVIGALMGLWPGIKLAAIAEAIFTSKGVIPDGYVSPTGAAPKIVAIVIAVIVGMAAASIVGRRAARVRPIEALADAAVQRARLGIVRVLIGAFAGLVAAGAFTASTAVPPKIVPALLPMLVMSLLVVVAVFARPILAGLVRPIALATRLAGVGGYLAAANSKAFRQRLAAAVTPVVLLVAVALVGLLQQTTLSKESRAQGAERLVSDHVAVAGPAGFTTRDVAEIKGAPGVATAIGLQPTTVYAGAALKPYQAVGVTDGPLGKVLSLGVQSGSSAPLGANDVGLSSQLASELHQHVGDDVTFRLGDGAKVERKVAMVYSRSLGFGDVVLSFTTIDQHITESTLSTALITDAAASASPDAFWQTFASQHPGTAVGGKELMSRSEAATATSRAWVSYTLFGMAALLALIALINTLILATAARTREFAQMRLLGATRRQISRMLRWEAFIITVLGLALGGAIALAALAPYGAAVTGSRLTSVPLGIGIGLPITLLTVVTTATLLPTLLTLRSGPVGEIAVQT